MESHRLKHKNRWLRSFHDIGIAIRRFDSRMGTIAGFAVLIAWGNSVLMADDVLILEHGGRIVGRWENRDKQPEENYRIALPEGGGLTVNAAKVQRVVAGQAEPRPMLEEDSSPRRWVHGTQRMESRGYVRHGSRWRMPQDVQLIEEREDLDRRQKEWLQKLRHWRGMLATPQARQAYEKILAVNDPMAVWALRALLRDEYARQVKLLYIHVLGDIACQASVQALVEISLQDPDEEVFYASLAELVRLKPPQVTSLYVESLTHSNNARLNRAAHALGRLGDPSCMAPLIDALITTHYVILPPRFKARQTSFVRSEMPDGSSPWEGTAYTSQDSPIVLCHTFRNEEVLQALIQLSGGVNFGFYPQAWKSWLANQQHQSAAPLHARRTPADPDRPPR